MRRLIRGVSSLGAFLILFSSLSAQADALYDSIRLESEKTILVPSEQTERVWTFLKKRFSSPAKLLDQTFMTVESIEWFKDTYFDTPDKKLLQLWAGLRLRERIGEGGVTKELVQLKLTPRENQSKEAASLRDEIKFPVREEAKRGKLPGDANEILILVDGEYQQRFAERLTGLGADPGTLERSLVIRQERRRLYFRQDKKQFFTLTLDISDFKKYWYRGSFSQLEIEIGENTFTNANEEERNRFLAMQTELWRIVQDEFPGLHQDQTPKVVRSYQYLSSRGPLAHYLMLFDEVVLVGAGMVSFLLFSVILGLKRARAVRAR